MSTETDLGVVFLIGIAIIFIMVLSYILMAVPTYFLAKKANYKNAWFAFIPLLSDLLSHDISFGKENRKWFLTSLGAGFIGGFLTSIGEGNQNSFIYAIGYLIIALVLIYDLYSIYKLYKSFGVSTALFVLQFIPIANIIVYWYIALSSKYQYAGTQNNILNRN